jgi:outer membrane protein, multidrug efflux system
MNPRITLLFWLPLAANASSAQTVTLEQGLHLAKSNRAAIRAAHEAVERAKHTRRALSAYPATTLGAGASNPSTLGATDQDLYLDQPLDVFGRAQAGRGLGEAAVIRAEGELRESQIRVQSDVLEQFARALAAKDVLVVRLALRDLAAQLLSATSRRIDEGQVPEIQARRAKIELDRASQAAVAARTNLAAAIRSLAGAVGLPGVEDTSGGFDISPPSGPDVSQRPDLLALRAEVVASRADARIATVNRLPALSLVALRSPWGDDRGRVGARFQLTWSLWDDGKNLAETRAAEARRRAAEAAYGDARRRAESELAAVDIDLDAAAARIESLGALLVATRSLVELSRVGFVEGVGTQIDVLEATRSLRELEEEAVEARLERSLAVTRRLAVSGLVLEALR